MQPQQPGTPPQNNYDFIMNPSAATKKSLLGGGGGNSMASRILLVVLGLFVLVIVLGIGIKLLSGGGGGAFNKTAMLSVAQDQTELVRLSASGVSNSVSQASKNFSATAKLGLSSQQQELLTYLSAHGYKIDPKQLTLKQSAQSDSQLADAKSSSTFDQAYKTVMSRQLTIYQQDLDAAYKSAKGPNAQTILSEQYDASQLLTTQLTGN